MNYSMHLEKFTLAEEDPKLLLTSKTVQDSPINLNEFKINLFPDLDMTDFRSNPGKTDINSRLKILESEMIKEQDRQKSIRENLQKEFQIIQREKKEIKVKEDKLKEYQNFLKEKANIYRKAYLN